GEPTVKPAGDEEVDGKRGRGEDQDACEHRGPPFLGSAGERCGLRRKDTPAGSNLLAPPLFPPSIPTLKPAPRFKLPARLFRVRELIALDNLFRFLAGYLEVVGKKQDPPAPRFVCKPLNGPLLLVQGKLEATLQASVVVCLPGEARYE